MRGAGNSLTGRRILVVEDDALIAMAVCDTLAESGASPLGPVASVRCALSALDERPDAVLLDVNLRGQRSTEVARAAQAAGIAFVLLTGYSRGQLDDPAFDEAPLLPKPVDHTQLIQLLARILSP